MQRRDFIKLLGVAGLSAFAPWPRRLARAQQAAYDGPLLVSIQAEGGWDVTSFCDPKVNTPGELPINHWADTAGVQTIGGSAITYAPFARNAEFFERFHDDMLVINGVDTQTESHQIGTRHSWSGRVPAGYPTLSALAASIYGDGLPLAYITNGGYKETAGLTTYALIQDPSILRNLINSNQVPWGDPTYHDADELALVGAFRDQRLGRQMGRADLLPAVATALGYLGDAWGTSDQLQALADRLPEQLVSPIDQDGNWNPLLQQSQIALLCYDAGLTVAADLVSWGFDTHGEHDTDHDTSLRTLTNGLTYLWDAAEQMGLAERLVVMITSDFGRTPHYNDDGGKDHWAIGSAIFMQRGVAWTDRVVGATTDLHDALTINPTTLALDSSSNGIRIQPKHVQDAFRRLAGIDQHETSTRFPLDAEQLDLFNPALST